MKKTLLVAVAVALSALVFSCQEHEKEIKEPETVSDSALGVVPDAAPQTPKTEEVDNTEQTEKVFSEFKTLYAELLGFKNKPDFKTYGFGQGGPYKEWLTKVEDLKSDPDSKLLLRKRVLAGELEQLGFAYVSSKGQETEVTKAFNEIFSEAIASKPIERVESASKVSDEL